MRGKLAVVAAAAGVAVGAGAMNFTLQGARAQAAMAPGQSAAVQTFCAHAYKVGSFPEALASIQTAGIPLSAVADDEAGVSAVEAAARVMRTNHGRAAWMNFKERVSLFVIGDDCPSVYSNPFAARAQSEWIVSHEIPGQFTDVQVAPAESARVPRMAFATYYDASLRRVRLAVFLSRPTSGFVVSRLGALAANFQIQYNLASMSRSLDERPLEQVLGHSWLNEVDGKIAQYMDGGHMKFMRLADLARSGTTFTERAGICQVPASWCELGELRRVGEPCSCEVTERIQTGTHIEKIYNGLGWVVDWEEVPDYREQRVVRSGKVVREAAR
ncbi:MAG TPA: hypothetical protein VGD66_04295 [Allosphingosinicella sp.]|jgi:hypothetical protein